MSESEALNAEGTELAKRGALVEALVLYERALALDPSLAKAENNRGSVLRKLGRTEEARASFERALRLGSGRALPNLAAVLAEAGRFTDIDALVAMVDPAREADVWSAVSHATASFTESAAELRRARASGMDGSCVEFGIDGLRLVLPCIETPTHHILREREDWFENEIHFVRRLLRPGEVAVDVGANFGVYTLSMARAVGPTGLVLAFEPSWATRTFLEESVRRNDLGQVAIAPYALSREAGTAEFFNAGSPELSSLTRAADGDGPYTREVVNLRTLDEASRVLDVRRASFLKLDAEGEETRILQGAKRFLEQHDPLIMTELAHGKTVNQELLGQLRELGMELFYLAPGPLVLHPLTQARVDARFLLNVFACSSQRRALLASRNLLATRSGVYAPSEAESQQIKARLRASAPHRDPPPALAEAVEQCVFGEECLFGELASSAANRLEALERSLATAVEACGTEPPRVASLLLCARTATALGQRGLGVKAALKALSLLDERPTEPFLLDDVAIGPSPRFDEVEVRTNLAAWTRAALHDFLLHEKAYSSVFDPTLVELATKALEGPYEQPLAKRIVGLFAKPLHR